MTDTGWIGVDLDGTLAFYDHWRGYMHVGAPIAPMVRRVKAWVAAGKTVKIFTARCGSDDPDEVELARKTIKAWCQEHLGFLLPITATKDYSMYELWDDRAVQVELNTGRRMDNRPDEHWTP